MNTWNLQINWLRRYEIPSQAENDVLFLLLIQLLCFIPMIVFPNAKINLGLQIVERMKNGYHAINTCFYPIPLTDALEFIPAKKKTSFQSLGANIPDDGKSNLVVRAYQLLKKDFQLPEIDIHLLKIIPIGAGLGGGSSDAAFMLKALNEHYQLFLDDSFLEVYAEQLGSDCPFFISNQPAYATGTGTDLSDINIDLSGYHLVLVYPNIHVSTQQAYSNVSPKMPETDLKKLIESKDFNAWKRQLINDFEASVFSQHADLEKIKNALYENGALYASMSGSGSSLFGIFDKQSEINFDNKDYFVRSMPL